MTATATQTPVAPVAVQRLWPGETFVLLGGGPSLTRKDVAYVKAIRQRPLMTSPVGTPAVRVIAIKEAHELAPWADVLYAADSSWWSFYRGVPSFTGLKFGIQGRALAAHDAHMPQWSDVQVLQDTGDEGLELQPTGLRTGANSGYQAVNLAVHLGAAKIILLGFDMWSGEDGQANWHQGKRQHLASPYPLFLQRFASIVQPLKDIGVEVVNCSRRTVLTAFPRVPLEEALL